MQIEIIAATFSDSTGAKQMCHALCKILQGSYEIVVVTRDEQGSLSVTNHLFSQNQSTRVDLTGFVAGIMLGGTVADSLFGSASGALLAHPVDLGISERDKINFSRDINSSHSILFMQHHTHMNGSLQHLSDQTGGTLHYLAMSNRTAIEINIMTSTLSHYWK